MTPTDTSEKGLETLIVRRLIGQAYVPSSAPEDALVGKEASASYGGAGYAEGDLRTTTASTPWTWRNCWPSCGPRSRRRSNRWASRWMGRSASSSCTGSRRVLAHTDALFERR